MFLSEDGLSLADMPKLCQSVALCISSLLCYALLCVLLYQFYNYFVLSIV